MLRITGGRFRGRKLATLPGHDVRPSSARLRQALFDVIGGVEERRGLDLCCGVGTFGLEALSREASHVTFIDLSPRALNVVRDNVATLGVDACATIARGDARKAARIEALLGGEGLDWIYVDPPYALWENDGNRDAIRMTLESLAAAGLVRPGADLLCEHRSKTSLFETVAGFDFDECRTYGEGSVSLFTATAVAT